MSTSANVAQVIQLAVAPVFLLSSVGTILSVLSSRLARTIDRARVLAERKENGTQDLGIIESEMGILVRRRKLINMAITSGVGSALLVCLLIAAAFIGTVLQVDVAMPVATLFVTAMMAFVLTLLFFLREILLSTSHRIDSR